MNEFRQLFVLQEFSLGNMSVPQFEQFLLDRHQTRVRFAEELEVADLLAEEGFRSDLLFYIHEDDIFQSLSWRSQLGVMSWQDIMNDEELSLEYPKELLEKYPLQ